MEPFGELDFDSLLISFVELPLVRFVPHVNYKMKLEHLVNMAPQYSLFMFGFKTTHSMQHFKHVLDVGMETGNFRVFWGRTLELSDPEVAAARPSRTGSSHCTSGSLVPSTSHFGVLASWNFEVSLLVLPFVDVDHVHIWYLGAAFACFALRMHGGDTYPRKSSRATQLLKDHAQDSSTSLPIDCSESETLHL